MTKKINIIILMVTIMVLSACSDDKEISIEEKYGIENELLTEKEMNEVVERYRSDKSLTDDEVEDLIREDYGDENALAFSEDLFIKEGMSDEDKHHILTDLGSIYAVSPHKVISKSDSGSEKYKKRMKNYSEIAHLVPGLFLKDTKGFYNIEGLNIGYPVGAIAVDEDLTPYMLLTLQALNDKEFKVSETEQFVEKLKKIEVNGESIYKYHVNLSNYGQFPEELNFQDMKKNIDKEEVIEKESNAVIPDNSIIELVFYIPLNETMIDKKYLELDEAEILLYPSTMGEPHKINLDINDIEMNLEWKWDDNIDAIDFGIQTEIINIEENDESMKS